jgi:hypothetical protein
MSRVFKIVTKFLGVFFVMTIINSVGWEYIAGDLYDCTDATVPGYLEPGHWVHAFDGRGIAAVPKIVHGRSMSEPDAVLAGWSQGRLLSLWFAFFAFQVLVSTGLSCIIWQRGTDPNQTVQATAAAPCS